MGGGRKTRRRKKERVSSHLYLQVSSSVIEILWTTQHQLCGGQRPSAVGLLLRLTASWDLPAISCSGLWSHAHHQNSPQVTAGCPLLQKPSVACGIGAGHQEPRVPWQHSSRWVRQASRAPQDVVSGPRHKARGVCTPAPATSPNKCATKALIGSWHRAAPGPAHSG